MRAARISNDEQPHEAYRNPTVNFLSNAETGQVETTENQMSGNATQYKGRPFWSRF